MTEDAKEDKLPDTIYAKQPTRKDGGMYWLKGSGKDGLVKYTRAPTETRVDDEEAHNGLHRVLEACDVIEHILSKDMRTDKDCLIANIKFIRAALREKPAQGEAIPAVIDSDAGVEDDHWPDVMAMQRMDIENGSWLLIAGESIIAENLDETGAKYLAKCVKSYRQRNPAQDVVGLDSAIEAFSWVSESDFDREDILISGCELFALVKASGLYAAMKKGKA